MKQFPKPIQQSKLYIELEVATLWPHILFKNCVLATSPHARALDYTNGLKVIECAEQQLSFHDPFIGIITMTWKPNPQVDWMFYKP